jgi:tetratricopeptide (TPR) repeat protein
LGYISYGTKDFSSGIAYMEKLFGLIQQDKVLKDDYSYYGKMLAESGKDSLAIEYFKNALKKDSSDYQQYDDIASSYKKLKKFEDYLDYSSRFVAKKPNLAIGDYFKLGQAFYSVAAGLDVKTDSIKQAQYLQKADSLFLKVETNMPTSYLGPFWRARVNSAIDKETTLGLAKPFYEKAEGLLVADTVKYKSQLSEIYSYMGYYYYQKEDKANSIEFWKKLLGIDPENAKAQEAIKALEKK